jgi:hypothetical protein
LLYVGGGIVRANAATELRALVDHLQVPVAYTLMGKGAVPDDHPFVLGMTGFWGTKYINEQCPHRRLDHGSSAPASRRPIAAPGIRSTPSAFRPPSSFISTSIPAKSAAISQSKSAPWPI